MTLSTWLLVTFVLIHLQYVAIGDILRQTHVIAFQMDNAILPCTLPTTDTPRYRIDWHFRNLTHVDNKLAVSAGKVVNGFARRCIFNTTDYSLRITSVSPADTGIYFCSNNFDGDVSSVQLDVYDMLAPTTISEVLVFNGDDVKLTCSVEKVTERVDWLRQCSADKPVRMIYSSGVTVNGFTGRFRVESNNDLHRDLSIQNIEREDAGFYECLNPVEPRIKPVFRVIIYANGSSSQITTLTATSGETVTLPCRAGRDSTPKSWWYQWQSGAALKQISYGGTVFTSHGTRYLLRSDIQGDYSLIVRNAAHKDSGLYSCVEVLSEDQARRNMIHLEITAPVEELQPKPSIADQMSIVAARYIMPILLVIFVVGAIIVISTIGMQQYRYRRNRTDDAELRRLADRLDVQLMELENRQSETENRGSFPPHLESRCRQEQPDITQQ